MTPKIKNYSQITNYLKDYFNFRKSLDKKFSYDVWAAELGFKSRSYMRMLTKGERTMTPKFIRIFAEKMNFNPGEERHLTLLASASKARSESQKRIYNEKILETMETSENKFSIKDYVLFLSSPNLSSLLLLISFDDIEATNKNLKSLLNITTQELHRGLKILKKLNLIEFKNKVWTSNSKSFQLNGSHKDQAFKEFQQKTMMEAADKLDGDLAFRNLRSIYFSLADHEIDDLKEEIEAFLTKMKRKYATNYIQNKRLTKLNLQAYPVSQLYKK